MYGEESRNPKKIIPKATMISVLGVGVFYVFVSWMAITGNGESKAVERRHRATPCSSSSAPPSSTSATGRSTSCSG